jgi:hypothetical protein
MGGCPPPFTISTITYKVVYAPAERAETLPLFLLYPYMYSVVYSIKQLQEPKKKRRYKIGILNYSYIYEYILRKRSNLLLAA